MTAQNEYFRFCFKLYLFGLRLGLANLKKNGFKLGIKKTLGKIIQPINAPDRFAEHYFVWRFLKSRPSGLIADVSSPKILALFASHCLPGGAVWASEIVERYLKEDRVLGKSLTETNRNLHFATTDACRLSYKNGQFDSLFSVSVIEHIPGDGDRKAVDEFIRVVKPGGYVLLTVPFHDSFKEVYCASDVYGRKFHGDPIFSHRLYDTDTLLKLFHDTNATIKEITIVHEKFPYNSFFYGLHENIRGLLGPFSLLIALFNYTMTSIGSSDRNLKTIHKAPGVACIALQRLR